MRIFNTIMRSKYVKVKKISDYYHAKEADKYMKIYNYEGRKNLCGEKIKLARTKKRITQRDLAARLQTQGITIERDSISRIEIGTRFVTDYELKILAKTLDVSMEWLTDEETMKTC